MNKINGYTEEEAKCLVEYIKEGKSKGKTLTYLFETYGLRYGRAKGSVRNYYYTLMRNEKGDERIVKLLDGSSLKVEKIREFTEEETDEVLRQILAEKSKGLSVRRAIFNLADGDDKLMLRLQNKYRNTLKKDPARIAGLAKELGVEEWGGATSERRALTKELLERRLENEINALYDRIAQRLKEENERLRLENEKLKAENVRLQSS
jgi:predicted metal-dependent hydrolase